MTHAVLRSVWYLVLGSRILQNTPMRVLTGGASARVVYFLAIDGSIGSALMKVGMDGWEIVSGRSLFHSTTVLWKNEFAIFKHLYSQTAVEIVGSALTLSTQTRTLSTFSQ